MTAVDSRVYKNKALEESGALLKLTHKTLISCEIVQIDGTKNSTEPVFVVDVRCKNTFEYCAEIVQAVKELFDDGISSSGTAVAVSRIDAPILDLQGVSGLALPDEGIWDNQHSAHNHQLNAQPHQSASSRRRILLSFAYPQTLT